MDWLADILNADEEDGSVFDVATCICRVDETLRVVRTPAGDQQISGHWFQAFRVNDNEGWLRLRPRVQRVKGNVRLTIEAFYVPSTEPQIVILYRAEVLPYIEFKMRPFLAKYLLGDSPPIGAIIMDLLISPRRIVCGVGKKGGVLEVSRLSDVATAPPRRIEKPSATHIAYDEVIDDAVQHLVLHISPDARVTD